jgi:hypothetical protein
MKELTNSFLHSWPAGLVSHYILSAVCRCFRFPNEGGRISRMLRELLDAKINKCKREIRDSTIIPIEGDRILAQIMACQWV